MSRSLEDDPVADPDVVDELSEEIAGLVHHLVNAWDAYLEARVREMDVGLTGRQATALWMANDPLSMGELSTQLGCDPSSATGIVDRLERKGLVRRVADPTDRRAKRVELTPEGRKAPTAHRATGHGGAAVDRRPHEGRTAPAP